jgi:hypothetical protein
MRYAVSKTNDDKTARLTNAQLAKTAFEAKGLTVKYSSSRKSSSVASYHPVTKQISINRSHTNWVNPAAAAILSRRSGYISSSSPMHTFYHELGHARDKNILRRSAPHVGARVTRGIPVSKLAKRVSRYAATNTAEFVAETYAGRRTGRRYDHQVMRAYREARGLAPIRMGSRVARGAAPVANPRAVARDRKRRSR